MLEKTDAPYPKAEVRTYAQAITDLMRLDGHKAPQVGDSQKKAMPMILKYIVQLRAESEKGRSPTPYHIEQLILD
jgi:hypothetical protein